MAAVGRQPIRLLQTVQKGRRTRIAADPASSREEADLPTFGVGDGMQSALHAVFGSTGQAAPLVVVPALFDRRRVTLWCAFKYLRKPA
jgi:hypothetical protein